MFLVLAALICRVAAFDAAFGLQRPFSSPFYSRTLQETSSEPQDVNIVRRFDNSYEVPLTNIDNSYYQLSLAIGTPPQLIAGALDTGSSDVWVLGSSCSGGYYSNCSVEDDNFQTFSSSTYTANDTLEFKIQYGDGTYAFGFWGHDTVSPGGQFEIKDLSFAVVNDTNASDITGIFGVGLADLEQTLDSLTSPYNYLNLPAKMKANGLIKKNLYSLFLNNVSAPHGSILFGGIDHSKYTGTLETVSLTGHNSTTVKSFLIEFAGVSFGKKTLAHGAYYGLLDSGTTLLYVPGDILESMAAQIDSKWSDYFGYYVTGCNIPDPDDGYDFHIGGITIKVPFNQLLVTMSDDPSEYEYKGDQLCALAMAEASSDDVFTFGDFWLSSAYVVFDLDDLEVQIAQAKYSTSAQDTSVLQSKTKSSVYTKSSPNSSVKSLTTSLTGPVSSASRGHSSFISSSSVVQHRTSSLTSSLAGTSTISPVSSRLAVSSGSSASSRLKVTTTPVSGFSSLPASSSSDSECAFSSNTALSFKASTSYLKKSSLAPIAPYPLVSLVSTSKLASSPSPFAPPNHSTQSFSTYSDISSKTWGSSSWKSIWSQKSKTSRANISSAVVSSFTGAAAPVSSPKVDFELFALVSVAVSLLVML
ncbi:unnamed protein product [Kuraishia capsulata CBS 1993]|uniref:candidapepsin n=1 Tax=Kuraishia capsulata CBS 1993 TaxID=1382522 RepID=W6MHQ6_9ASCO|nr:uncharacterized protein KUCA_T00001820001 [Kuraishia capsulata CBS 1993]CDK25849.1 unnamed protein product [Kuraishia capsulata CBS 1993]